MHIPCIMIVETKFNCNLTRMEYDYKGEKIMKLLLIEDEEDLASALSKGLRKQGYFIDVASDGEEALDYYYATIYDLIILDLNLPKRDGLELLDIIRKDNKEIKIIIVSARGSIEQKIEGLDNGANDYLTKPFDFQELLARIRSLLRRNFIQNDLKIKTDYFICDMSNHTIYDYEGEEIKITPKEYMILEYLLVNKEKPISAEELLEKVWEDKDYLADIVKVHVSTLRKKLRDKFDIDFIEHVQKIGYRFKG